MRVDLDGLVVHVPRYPNLPLHPATSTRHIECNHTRAQLFYSSQSVGVMGDKKEAEMFRKQAMSLLTRASRVFDQLGIPFWISSGTCLGMIYTVYTRACHVKNPGELCTALLGNHRRAIFIKTFDNMTCLHGLPHINMFIVLIGHLQLFALAFCQVFLIIFVIDYIYIITCMCFCNWKYLNKYFELELVL